MNCTRTSSLLSQYLDGELSPRQAADIQAHLLTCRACTAGLEQLTKTLNVLESLPANQEEVDLYDRFHQRLEKTRGRRRWRFPAVTTRQWVTAGIAAVLVLSGSVLGAWLRGPSTLYVSNLRSAHSGMYSSIALAAEEVQNRWRVDDMLLADERLSPRIDVRSRGETIERVLVALSERTKVKITPSPDLANQRVYLRLNDVPISTVMSEIRKLSDSDWKMTETASGRTYELICSDHVKKMATAVAEAQAMSQTEETLRRLHTAIETHNPELLENTTLEQFADTVRGDQSPDEIEAYNAGFLLIDEQVISTLMAGQEYIRTYDELSEEHKGYFVRHFGSGFSSVSGFPDSLTLTIKLERSDTGGISLCIGCSTKGRSSGGGRGIWDPVYTSRGSNLITNEEVDELHNEVSRRNAAYDDPRLQVNLGNKVASDKVPQWQRKSTHSIMEMLDLISERTNLKVVSDYFTVRQNLNRIISKELTLGELLAILDGDFDIAWYLSDDNVLRLVHRQWPLLRETEPDWALVKELRSQIDSSGTVDLAAMGRLAKESDLKRVGTYAALDSNDEANLLRNIVDNFGPALVFYDRLSPEQRRAAESKTGLHSSRMTEGQRRQAILVGHEIAYGTTANFKLSDMNEEFTFSISRVHASVKQVERMVGRQFMDGNYGSTSFTFGGGNFRSYVRSPKDPDLPVDWVIIRYNGDREWSRSVGVFNMPTPEQMLKQ